MKHKLKIFFILFLLSIFTTFMINKIINTGKGKTFLFNKSLKIGKYPTSFHFVKI